MFQNTWTAENEQTTTYTFRSYMLKRVIWKYVQMNYLIHFWTEAVREITGTSLGNMDGGKAGKGALDKIRNNFKMALALKWVRIGKRQERTEE